MTDNAADRIAYLKTMIEDRDSLVVYEGDIASGSEIQHEQSILIVGDVGRGAEIQSESGQIYILGNVHPRAELTADDRIIISGTANRTLAEDSLETVAVFDFEQPRSVEAVQDVMQWIGNNDPLWVPGGMARSAVNVTIVGVFAAAAALGTEGVKHVFGAASLPAAAQMIYNAVTDNYFAAMVGAGVGEVVGNFVSNIGRPAGPPPLALRNGTVIPPP